MIINALDFFIEIIYLQFIIMNIFSNGINYADGDAPIIMPPAIEALNYDGWYYKNVVKGKKINWYIPFGTNCRITDLKMVQASLKLINKTSAPFFTIYTKPTGSGDAASWYHARRTYIVSAVTLVNGQNYNLWAEVGAVNPVPVVPGHTNVKLVVDSFSSRGSMSQTDQILAIAFGTNSSSSAGNVEFVLREIDLIKTTETLEYLVSNDELFTSFNMSFDAMTVSTTDTRKPGNSPAFVAHCSTSSVTKATKLGGQKVNIGHNASTNDSFIDGLQLPRLGNVAGKDSSSVADDNTETIFNNFFASVDFKVLTNVAGASCSVEAFGEDANTQCKVYADADGVLRMQYRGVDLVSKGHVAAGDEIANGYGWTTRDYAGTLSLDKWYRLTQVIHFSEAVGSDIVRIMLHELTQEDGVPMGPALWDITDNTWEAYYLYHSEQAPNGNLAPSVDCLQFQCRGSPVNVDVLTVKNVIYSTSKTAPVSSLAQLLTSIKGIVTYYSGNQDPDSVEVMTNARYAFMATGGFSLERGFDTIRARPMDAIGRFDVTDAVQVGLPLALFNSKLGVFDTVSDTFAYDELSVSASEFVNGLTINNVLSVGKYSTLYSDFVSYVRTYFGYSGGFSSLFNAASEFEINNGVFDAAALMNLMTGSQQTEAGAYTRDLSGSIVIGNINKLLRYAVDANVFGNRSPSVKNFGVADGFQAGDMVWIPEGTTIKLNLDIDVESFAPVNNEGPANVAQETNYTSGNFSSNTSATTTNICRVLTAPLLIKMV